MRKKLLLLLLSLALAAGSLVGCGPKVDTTTLIVGSPELSGNFIPGFGNNAYDVWVRNLILGYSTYVTTPAGEIVLDDTTVVKELVTEVDDKGNKIYQFTLYDDLKWNDGSPITAADYVFYILWYASPQWKNAGASSTVGEGLVGYSAYYNGETDRFKGVNLIDDYTFSITIDAKELPYFFEITYASFMPLPMAVWAPGATIDINEDGAKIEGVNLEEATQEIATGERFKPTVTCGPYKFVSYENNAATMQKNEHYKGNYEGKKPQLETVIVRAINQATDVDQVINGEVDMVTGVIEGAKIEKAKADKNTVAHYYSRNGYGGFFIHCDFGPTAVKEVRHALAYLMDRDEIIKNVLGGYGSVVNAEYGLAQWMYEDNKDAIDALPHFTRDIAKANELLDQTEWRFEADGVTPFDPEKADAEGTYIRHNAAGEKLVINHFGTEDNDVTDNVELQLRANCPLAGIEFTLTRGDFDALLNYYYYSFELDPSERQYHTFNLASSFSVAYDPYYSYHSDWLGTWMNSNQVNDPEVDRITEAMRKLEPEQREEYSKLWLEWQQLFADILPVIPLYSNQYYDIHSKFVHGVNTTPFADWSDIICDIYKAK